MMKLQLAIDALESHQAISLVNATREFIDIIEIGTPLIKHEGLSLVRLLKNIFPEKELLVDMKTMDAGEYEHDFSFEIGANIQTVLGLADDKTIAGCIKSARKHNAKTMVDLINVPNLVERAQQMAKLGADIVGIHTGIDQQLAGQSPMAQLEKLAGNVNIDISVAGGVNLDNIDQIIAIKPSIIVVGGGITGQADPTEAARKIKEKMR